MARSKVAVLSSSPETVRDDIRRLLRILKLPVSFARAQRQLVVPDLQRTRWFPAAGTTPWQLDGALGYLHECGVPSERVRVLVRERPQLAATRALDTHCLGAVFRQYGVELQRVQPRDPVLPPAAFGEAPLSPQLLGALRVPQSVRDAQLLLLPALRLSPTFGVHGALANFAQLVLPELPELAPREHAQMLADLASLLRELCAASLTIADATIFGDGAGPSTPRPSLQNVLLASTDPIALDAVAGRLAGLRDSDLPHLALAAAMGLGRAKAAEIEIVGEQIEHVSFEGRLRRNLANWTLPPHRGALARRSAGWVAAARLDLAYEELLWRPLVGRLRLRRFERTPWGRLFASYRSIGV